MNSSSLSDVRHSLALKKELDSSSRHQIELQDDLDKDLLKTDEEDDDVYLSSR